MIAAGFKIVARDGRTRIACFGDSPELIDRTIFGARGATSRVVFIRRLYYRAEPLDWLRSRGGNVDACRTNDAALCAALYVEGGIDRLTRLEGDFVLALVDDVDRRVIALRSPLGVDPLFWMQGRDEIALSTSIRPLVEHLPSVDLDDAYAADFLASPLASVVEVPTERCAYRGVRRLLPGHLLDVRTAAGGSVSTRQYWHWRAETVAVQSIEEAGAMVRDRLQAAVRERLSRDAGTAAHFSGGMDSTALALLAEPLVAARGRRVEALSYVYTRDSILRQERQYIDSALQGHPAVRHHPIAADDFLRWDEHDTAPLLDEPATGSIFYRQSRVLTEVARNAGADTILCGDGADQLFFQPPSAIASDLLRTGKIRRALRVIHEHAAATSRSAWTILRETLSRPPRFSARDMELLCGEWFHWNVCVPRGAVLARPFFDPRVVALALGLPSWLHERAHPMKPVLAAAMRDVLPHDILHRRRKAHFGFLLTGYTRHQQWLEALAGDRQDLRERIQRIALHVLPDAPAAGRLEIALSYLKWLRDRPRWAAQEVRYVRGDAS